MNDAVVADGLTKCYGRDGALDRRSCASGDTIVALVGPNGGAS